MTILPGETSSADLHLPCAAPGQMLVSFYAGITQEQIDALNERYGATILRVCCGGPSYFQYYFHVLQIPQGAYAADLIAAYRQEEIVQYVHRNWYGCWA